MLGYGNGRPLLEMHQRRQREPLAHPAGNTALDLKCSSVPLGLAFFASWPFAWDEGGLRLFSLTPGGTCGCVGGADRGPARSSSLCDLSSVPGFNCGGSGGVKML
jgi:hypothetical protein